MAHNTWHSRAALPPFVMLAMLPALHGCGGGGDIPLPMSSAQAQTVQEPIFEDLHAILRPDSNGRWYVQTNWGPRPDPDHASAGVSWQVEQTSEYVRVFFLRPYRWAGAITVTSDDDFAGKVQGYSNLGLNSATIRIHVDGRQIDPGRILEYVPTAAQSGNLWVHARMGR